MTSVLVATTVAPYKALSTFKMDWFGWLENDLRPAAAGIGVRAHYHAVVELDGRGHDPYKAFHEALSGRGGTSWAFSIHDGAKEISSHERLVRICTGRNLAQECTVRDGYDWILFVDTDTRPPADAIPKLLDVGWPIVGGSVPSYCMGGPVLKNRPLDPPELVDLIPTQGDEPFGYEVQAYSTTAGFLLVRRDVFQAVRWGADGWRGLTDDPTYQSNVVELCGYPTLVRTDVVGEHPSLVGLESRDHDRTIY